MTYATYQLKEEIEILRKDLLFQLQFLSKPEEFHFDHFEESVQQLKVILEALKEEV